MNFGKRLRGKAAGMTQEQLARAADASNATVFKLETVEEQDPELVNRLQTGGRAGDRRWRLP